LNTHKPRVIMHSVVSVDGRLTTAPGVLLLFGDPRWTAVAGDGSDVYPRLMAEHQPGALLEGSGSLVVEGVQPEALPPFEGDTAALYADFLPEEVVNVPGRKWFAVVDGRGRVRGWMKEYPGEEWAGWHLLVLVCRSTPPEYLAHLRAEGLPYLVAGEARVDLAAALGKLAEQLGVATVVSTAGGKLNGALLRAGLVDAVSLDVFPAIIGGTDTPALADGPALGPEESPMKLALKTCESREDGHLWLKYDAVKE
jgi:2,5-diamino-6-(ribosylamino)-4(3H)-pyrimidinone 5'-phosphate reductase